MNWKNKRFKITQDMRSFKAGTYWVEDIHCYDSDTESVVIRRGKEDYCNIQNPYYLDGLLDAGVLEIL